MGKYYTATGTSDVCNVRERHSRRSPLRDRGSKDFQISSREHCPNLYRPGSERRSRKMGGGAETKEGPPSPLRPSSFPSLQTSFPTEEIKRVSTSPPPSLRPGNPGTTWWTRGPSRGKSVVPPRVARGSDWTDPPSHRPLRRSGRPPRGRTTPGTPHRTCRRGLVDGRIHRR